MNICLKPVIHLVVLACVLLACNTKGKNKKVKIALYSTTQTDEPIKISLFSLLEQNPLFESKTDSTGYCTFEMTVQESMFVLIQVGEKYGELYLSPASDLIIKENGQDYTIPLTFTGEGSEVNNYVSWVNSNVEKIKWANDRGLSELDFNEFSNRFDSLKNTISRFHDSYVDTVSLTDEEVAILEMKNRIKFMAVRQEYAFYQLNKSINEKFEAEKNGMAYIVPTTVKTIEKVINNITFDTTLLPDRYADYQILLNFHWHNKIRLPTTRLIGANGSHKLAPVMTSSLIQQANYPERIREFLLAFDLHYWLSAFGITPETESVLSRFNRRYPTSRYLPALKKNYNEWLAVSPGHPAPDFEGYTQDGKKISLKSLKGKIVYMDVWATWCGPCIAEIPASKRLQQEFLNEERVEFLNVSVDANKAHWETFLKKESEWKGLHIIVDHEMTQSFYKSYKLQGIPAYALIDQHGNIIDMKASRPSDSKILDQLKMVLNAVE